MEYYYLNLVLLISFVWACIRYLLVSYRTTSQKESCSHIILPPGPRPLPIIGNILALGNMPHQALATLSKTYGPLMTLKLGSITTIVISSPQIAKEALQKHDQALSSRTIPDAIRVHNNHHENSMLWLPASARWKTLRKITAAQMFTSKSLDKSEALRRRKVQQMVDYVHENCQNGGQAVDIGKAAFTTMLNLISNSFFSLDIANYNSKLSHEFSDLMVGISEQLGKPNTADYFPILRLIDPQGVKRKMISYVDRLFQIFDGIINERIKLRASFEASHGHDFLDSLLDLVEENNSELSFNDMQVLLLDFFLAGTDTSSSTVEWAMAELLRNPDKMRKAKSEIEQVLDGRPVQESDISKLPYLEAVVKETFRLHPPVPFLIPRKAESEVEIGGYTLPKNAQILVNVWAIGRDPTIWPDTGSFKPERFISESQADVKGKDFELIPFGAGRRMCPGLPLGHRMVHLMLASLIQSFDWELASNGLGSENVDLTEAFGLALHKAQPLRAIPIKL